MKRVFPPKCIYWKSPAESQTDQHLHLKVSMHFFAGQLCIKEVSMYRIDTFANNVNMFKANHNDFEHQCKK